MEQQIVRSCISRYQALEDFIHDYIANDPFNLYLPLLLLEGRPNTWSSRLLHFAKAQVTLGGDSSSQNFATRCFRYGTNLCSP